MHLLVFFLYYVICYVQILFEGSDHGIVCLAMDVVGAYVSWIDINLIANDRCIR